jgi:hypothetical protein
VKIKSILFSVLILMLISAGCSNNPNQRTNINKTSTQETVTSNMIFRPFDKNIDLSGVTILIIRADGKVIDKLVTDNKGEAQKKITVPIDRKFPVTTQLGARGTITAIAFKDGYKETVLFEVPISNTSAAQPFYMEPIEPESRNEPSVQLGNNHHLEILSLVEKYAPYAKTTK